MKFTIGSLTFARFFITLNYRQSLTIGCRCKDIDWELSGQRREMPTCERTKELDPVFALSADKIIGLA